MSSVPHSQDSWLCVAVYHRPTFSPLASNLNPKSLCPMLMSAICTLNMEQLCAEYSSTPTDCSAPTQRAPFCCDGDLADYGVWSVHKTVLYTQRLAAGPSGLRVKRM